jgi:hypothetical protein
VELIKEAFPFDPDTVGGSSMLVGDTQGDILEDSAEVMFNVTVVDIGASCQEG